MPMLIMGKLEPRSMKCILIGYKLWCLETKKLVIIRDVIFYETSMIRVLAPKDSGVLRPCREMINRWSLRLVWFLIQMSGVCLELQF